MPTYEYQCDKCGRFDHWQSITSEPLAECPKCGSTVKRLISGNVGIIFKGSGFYCTDNNPRESAEKDPAPASVDKKQEEKK